MKYIIEFEAKAIEDLAKLKKSGNKALITKIERLLFGNSRTPYCGNWTSGSIERYSIRLLEQEN